jgi:UDP-GlcNAc:undecaprenyl-phosphate GlcNAc-1-phosphate transferase
MQYLMPFILAMVVTMAWLPVLVRFAGRWGIIDAPGARKLHVAPIPRVGGLAMTLGVMIAALLTIHLQPQDRWFLAAAAVLVIFGTIDDRFDLDYRIKLIGQLIAVGIVVLAGNVQAHAITLDEKVLLPEWLSVALKVLFLVGITNAINLADGLDGLAGGTTFLCLCAIALLASVGGQASSIALALAFAGAVIGFLRFNTFPASVFMGDAGSQLLGFTVGVLSVRATQSEMSQISASIPILLLALPILDTLSVMVQRIGEGRSPFSADRNHIHHKLLAMGFDHHEAVMVIYSLQASLFVTAYILRFESDYLILAVVSTFFAAAIIVLQWAARCRWQVRKLEAPVSATPTPTPAAAAHAGEMGTSRLPLASVAAVLPRVAYWAIALGLFAYALLIVFDTGRLPSDFRLLIILLLALVVGFSVVLRTAPLNIVEKGALYVTATTLVYIDTVLLPENRGLSALTWGAVGIAVAGTAIRLRLKPDRRFQITPLDLIVLFMALVVPSLPGTLRLPEGGALAIAKLVILFYALEVLASRTDARALWLRGAFAAVLGALVIRPSMPF